MPRLLKSMEKVTGENIKRKRSVFFATQPAIIIVVKPDKVIDARHPEEINTAKQAVRKRVMLNRAVA
jgi:hypothetical protein